jgi:hypothetical protein
MVAKHRSANAIFGTITPIMQLISQVGLGWKSSRKINQWSHHENRFALREFSLVVNYSQLAINRDCP